MLDFSHAVIVVEGKKDEQRLSSIIKSNFVQTNGSEVSRETIEYIKTLSKTYPIILLTDPDGPGEQIRARLEQEIGEVYHVFFPREKCQKKNKIGVENADDDTILEAFNHIVLGTTKNKGTLTFNHLFKLGLIGTKDARAKRTYLGKHYRFGETNGKTLLKRLNQLNVSFEEITKELAYANFKTK
ncbi:MAG: ribonuclease M5 [Bacilli bacterium]|jgi:ribonuclease M5